MKFKDHLEDPHLGYGVGVGAHLVPPGLSCEMRGGGGVFSKKTWVPLSKKGAERWAEKRSRHHRPSQPGRSYSSFMAQLKGQILSEDFFDLQNELHAPPPCSHSLNCKHCGPVCLPPPVTLSTARSEMHSYSSVKPQWLTQGLAC